MRYLLIITALLFTGCQDFFFQEVDPANAPKLNPKLNMVSLGESGEDIIVILGKVIPSSEASDPWDSNPEELKKYQVNDATITVKQGNETHTLTLIENEKYINDNPWLKKYNSSFSTEIRAYSVYGDTTKRWEAGKSYTIEANANDLTAKGVMNVYEKTSFAKIGETKQIESVATDQYEFTKENGPYYEFNIKDVPNDLPNLFINLGFVNYYANGDKVSGPEVLSGSSSDYYIPQCNQMIYYYEQMALRQSNLVNYSIIPTVSISEYDQATQYYENQRQTTLDSAVLIIDLIQFTPDFLNFVNSIESNNYNDGNPFVEPSQVYTNLDEGMGFLYSSNKLELRIRFK